MSVSSDSESSIILELILMGSTLLSKRETTSTPLKHEVQTLCPMREPSSLFADVLGIPLPEPTDLVAQRPYEIVQGTKTEETKVDPDANESTVDQQKPSSHIGKNRFPLCVINTSESIQKKATRRTAQQSKPKREERRQPALPPGERKCESCDQIHPGTYGAGRYCSFRCSRAAGARKMWAKRWSSKPSEKRVPKNLSDEDALNQNIIGEPPLSTPTPTESELSFSLTDDILDGLVWKPILDVDEPRVPVELDDAMRMRPGDHIQIFCEETSRWVEATVMAVDQPLYCIQYEDLTSVW
eukprot:CAMPEP_0184689952 /NCGR_PEP_ID=MMETSP0312-20130426/30943_1 /TAXON_ID=31354 /ORGANISM="Compsopogon coeruleus, Strain SAG 36.94" /LENGTH=297 /DNA_ID=CAMNT_0027147361 /DNA_START=630 /DNA_END=1520 /DNA_ORIENTATION=-